MAVETECCDNGKAQAIAVSGNSNIINLCCGDSSTTGGDTGSATGVNDNGDSFADETPMTSESDALPADEMGGENGWIGDTLFGVRCCLDDGTVVIRWTVEGVIELTRNDVPIFTSTGTETEYTDTYTPTGNTLYRLTAPNGVDKKVLLKETDCLDCTAVYTLTVDCNTGTENSVILTAGGINGTETVTFYRDATEIGSGLISNIIDTPGVGAWVYQMSVDGGQLITSEQIPLPEYCADEWSQWLTLSSEFDFDTDRLSSWTDTVAQAAKHYVESGVITPPLVASGTVTQFEIKGVDGFAGFQNSAGLNSLIWYDAYNSKIAHKTQWFPAEGVFDFDGANIAGFRLHNSATSSISGPARPHFYIQYRYKLPV